MIITVKTIKKIFVSITFAAVILAFHPALAWNRTFTNYPVKDLKVIEVNVEEETAILQSPDGETATLTVGDVVGLEDYEIVKISKSIIKLEGPSDDSGRYKKSVIPVIPIVIDKSLFIPDVKPATGEPLSRH